MSFLGQKIKDIIAMSGSPEAVSRAMAGIRGVVADSLEQLSSSGDLRVHDGDRGGCLRGNARGRRNLERGRRLSCSVKSMRSGKAGRPSEVPYTRAMFNARSLGGYDLIAYECPFVRKTDDVTNADLLGRSLSCDLLGAAGHELCCIEVKIKPDRSATTLPYALAEGFAYACALDWILRERPDELRAEAELCCRDFDFSPPEIVPGKTRVTFAVAGPWPDYFQPYETRVMKGHDPEWFRLRHAEASPILETLRQEYPGWLRGYMSLSQGVGHCVSEPTNDADVVVPVFKGPVEVVFNEPGGQGGGPWK